MKKLCMLLCVCFAVCLFFGCGGKSGTGKKAGEKVFRLAVVDPQVPLDMHLNTYSDIMRLTDNVTESLFISREDGSIAPVLIEAMPSFSPETLTYSFTIKSGVQFHNGKMLTSRDVKYSLERVVKKQSMASLLETVVGYRELQSGSAAELAGIKVIDDTHFTITLSRIYTPFLAALSTPYTAIYPADACEEAGDTWGTKTLIGTGPFKLDSYTPDVGAEMSKFAEYHGGAAILDKINYKFVPDANTQVLEYQKGNVDFVGLKNSLYPVYANNPQLKDQIHSYQMVGGYYFLPNVKVIPDAKVREALSLAVDRKAICESVLHGTASVPSSFIPPALIGHDKNALPFEYAPDRAKALLAEAGFANGYDLRVTVISTNSLGLQIATAFQEEAKPAGINVQIEQVDRSAWTDMKRNGGIDCSVSNWYVDYSDPDSMLYPVSAGRVDLSSSFWHNSRFEKLMDDGVLTDDTAARQKIYEQAEHILTREDFAALPLINEVNFYLLNPKVTGFTIDSANRIYCASTDIQ